MNAETRADLYVEAFEGLDGLRARRGHWNALLEVANVNTLFNDPTWVEAHVEAFGNGDDVFGWSASRGSEPVALFAFRREPSRGALALSRAISAADGTFDTDYCEPLVRAGEEELAVRTLLELLSRRSELQAVVLSGLPDDSPLLAALRSELRRLGLSSREHSVPCLALELPDSFDGYLEQLKPRMRTKVRSAIRNAEEVGAAWTLCTRKEELEDYLEELFDLHGRRWRAVGKEGSFVDPSRRRFYRAIAPDFLARGELRLSRLAIDGKAVASQMGLVRRRTYYQLQEGYAPEESTRRVGVALRGLGTQALIAEGVRRYDFLAGDSRHKRDWGGGVEGCSTLAFALPRWKARLSYGLRALVDRLRG